MLRELADSMTILGVIPARGGSKGIPRKNIKMIAEKPLIQWTIESAKSSELISRFVVSTEDAEIAKVSKECGAEVIDRPLAFAADETSTVSVLQHAMSVIEADVVVILQPTSPERNIGLIDKCIQKFIEAKTDNLATGFICKYEYGTYTSTPDLNGFL